MERSPAAAVPDVDINILTQEKFLDFGLAGLIEISLVQKGPSLIGRIDLRSRERAASSGGKENYARAEKNYPKSKFTIPHTPFSA
jgi:hypothetical protein